MKQIVLASGNKGKLQEFAEMFQDFSIEMLPQSDFQVPEVAETGTTFVENAIIKARHAAQITGLPAIADDSGIEVDALNGAPGIYSARYSETGNDVDNYQKLLTAMAGQTNRQARFQCVLVYMRHSADPSPIICQASWEGQVAERPAGEQGHGYDPIFIPVGENRSAAEMSAPEKNAVSHRGQALAILLEMMQQKAVL